jgi:hypothetical protein
MSRRTQAAPIGIRQQLFLHALGEVRKNENLPKRQWVLRNTLTSLLDRLDKDHYNYSRKLRALIQWIAIKDQRRLLLLDVIESPDEPLSDSAQKKLLKLVSDDVADIERLLRVLGPSGQFERMQHLPPILVIQKSLFINYLRQFQAPLLGNPKEKLRQWYRKYRAPLRRYLAAALCFCEQTGMQRDWGDREWDEFASARGSMRSTPESLFIQFVLADLHHTTCQQIAHLLKSR